MTGSDFLDACISTHRKSDVLAPRKAVVLVVYLGLTSLVKQAQPNYSALSDHLYSLKADADAESGKASLLADLVTNTTLIKRLRLSASEKGNETGTSVTAFAAGPVYNQTPLNQEKA